MRVVSASLVCAVVAACGPGLPSSETETGQATSGASASGSTTSSGGGGASTTGDEPTGAGMTGSNGTTGAGTSTTGDATTDVIETSGTGGTTGGLPANCCMVPAAPNAKVSGTTPVGPLALTWAWFGIFGGECGGTGVYVYEDPSQIGGSVGPRLEIFMNNPLLPGPAAATFIAIAGDGSSEFVEGEVEVVSADAAPEPSWCAPGDPVVMTDAMVELKFTILADGWDVVGEVAALYCPSLNVFCP